MHKKNLKLVDYRACKGRCVRELRKVLRQIDSGDVVGLSFVSIKRNGNVFAYADCDDGMKVLGSIDLLRDHVKKQYFEPL